MAQAKARPQAAAPAKAHQAVAPVKAQPQAVAQAKARPQAAALAKAHQAVAPVKARPQAAAPVEARPLAAALAKARPRGQSITSPVKARSQSAQRIQDAREEKRDAKRNGLLAKVVGGAVAKAGKGVSMARDLATSQAGQSGGDAIGTAAGGPIWAAVKEISQAVDGTRNNRVMTAAFGSIKKLRTQQRPGQVQGKATAVPASKAIQAGTIRDTKGRCI